MDNQQENRLEEVENVVTMSDHEDYEKSFKTVKRGEYLTGRVLKLDENGVYVDIGYKQEGFIPVNQLSYKKISHPEELLKIGDEIPLVVLKAGDLEGEIILSSKRAELETAWRNVTKAFEDGSIVKATVVEHVKGGLLVDLGLRGFVPASQVDVRPVKDLSDFVGEVLRLKVIEIDRARRKVVLSRKKVLEEEKVRMKDETLDSLYEGQVVQGIVARTTNFGAFINLGGVDGLVHISELAWKRIKHPSEVVSIGQEVEVMVLKVDKKRERISLSLRQALPDPWITIEETMRPGQTVKGVVSKIAKKYIFVELMDGVEGVIPLHELSGSRSEKPESSVKEGQEIEVKVTDINCEARRITLSLKQNEKEANEKEINSFSTKQSSGGATIGDRIKAKMKDNDG